MTYKCIIKFNLFYLFYFIIKKIIQSPNKENHIQYCKHSAKKCPFVLADSIHYFDSFLLPGRGSIVRKGSSTHRKYSFWRHWCYLRASLGASEPCSCRNASMPPKWIRNFINIKLFTYNLKGGFYKVLTKFLV